MKETGGEGNEKLRRVCPDLYAEVPMSGVFYLFVTDTEAKGGLSGLDSLMPAIWTLGAWAQQRWPLCVDERKRQGFPKVIEKSDGNFRWEERARNSSRSFALGSAAGQSRQSLA
jgi:hypothetical protein